MAKKDDELIARVIKDLYRESTMKYRIEQLNTGSRTLWVVKQHNKILSHHVDSSEAHATVQRYIAEDQNNPL